MAEKDSVRGFGLYFAPTGTLHSFAPAGALHIHIGMGSRKKADSSMTDKQLDTILRMVVMILDGCKDLEEAKRKVLELLSWKHTPSVGEVK